MAYNHQEIEKKWQKKWDDSEAGRVSDSADGLYHLVMFPYPSGSGLHVGHVESYSAVDMLTRMERMRGKNVLFPMGYDAFGLPAENYAIKTGVHPAETTKQAIETFRRQLKAIGLSFDWSREVSTADPSYYRWTQWLFLLFYKNGLAYRAKSPVNWCNDCHTVLANEQVVDGKCERCKNEVVQKELEQWFFKIKDYADRLLEGLDEVDWPERIKTMQRNWIGRKEGITIQYHVKDSDEQIACFTTRPDTNFGATFVVIAPEHSFAKKIAEENQEVADYIKQAQKKTELERQAEGRTKTGVFTGHHAINNLNGFEMPIWISDFVLAGFGTGAVVGVPGHDLRDFQFATTFDIPVVRVVVGPDGDESEITREEQVQEDEGVMVNSDFINGVEILKAKEQIMDYMEEKGWGERATTYRIRDWLVSRQRYWGAPIPIIWCESCGPVAEENLPVELPTDVDFKPTGESPLASSKTFHNVKCPACDADARRESDTMDTFVDSSWYYLRYCDPNNEQAFADKKLVDAWCPVDLYVGGAEHAVMHLLYARFFAYALHDLGYVSFEEPFLKLRNQGMILGPDGEKMSKSRGNIINPDSVVSEYGADAIRLYEMFMGPLEDAKPWDTQGIVGIRRFLEKVWKALEKVGDNTDASLDRIRHKTIKKVTEDLEKLKFNTAISQLMVMVNALGASEAIAKDVFEDFVKLLAPLAPHLAEELWEKLGHTETIFASSWPEFDASKVVDDVVSVAVQINGKVRAEIELAPDASEEDALAAAQANEKAKKYLDGQTPKKVIYVAGRILNIVL